MTLWEKWMKEYDLIAIGGGNEVLFCWETAFAAAEWLIDSHGEGLYV